MAAAENVRQFYAGKNIFMTGATGFVGVCLLEKLLRSCPEVGNIYLLLRPKKEKEINERMEEIKKNSVFEKLKEDTDKDDLENLFSKLQGVAGDVGEPDLGLSASDRALLCREVNIVFHSAATLDFEATLKPTVQINLLGTRRVMELCTNINNLKCMVHVSSAYVNSFKNYAEEVIYPCFKSAEEVIRLTETLFDGELEEATAKILCDHPNTYTFTKHLAEHEVKKCEEKFPCAIVRPSMITAAWKEPMPGWTVSKNGPQGFLMGASKGIVRRLPVASDLVYDYIPVDIVINTLIVAACHVAALQPTTVKVFHCTTSTRKPFKWNYVQEKINGYLHKYPLKSAVWYPHLKLLPSVTWYRISAIFVHFIPALILDTVTRLGGGKPILMRLHRNVNSSLGRLEKFIFTEWMYPADRSDELHEWLSTEDKRTFGIAVNNLDWRDYFISLTQGVRKYLSKENPKNLAVARSKDKVLLVCHLLLQGLIYLGIWYLTSCTFGVSMSKSALIVPLSYFLFNLL